MKKVVENTYVTPVVTVNRVHKDKYYGVTIVGQGKGFVTRTEFDKGNYRILSRDNVTNANGWYDSNPSLTKLLETVVKNSNFEVFEFETYEELFKWLAE